MIYVVCSSRESFLNFIEKVANTSTGTYNRSIFVPVYTIEQLRGRTIDRTKDEVVFVPGWMRHKDYIGLLRELFMCIEKEIKEDV